MHITCPHCNATYKVGPVIKNALLVCFRCHTEFSVDEVPRDTKKETPAASEQATSLPLFKHSNNSRPEVPDADGSSEEKQRKEPVSEEEVRTAEPERVAEEKAVEGPVTTEEEIAVVTEGEKAPVPPARKSVAIWPWLIFILLVIGGSGFWYKQDIWMDHPWVRSVLINMQLPVEVRDKDWRIIPESVHGQWLTRDDRSRVLVIEGRVANLLYCELSPPQIQVHFFDDSGLDQLLGEMTLPITEPPSIEQVKHAPFEMPDIDRVPVEAQGERGFFLVLDSLPERTADFTLTAVVNKQ